MTNANAADAGKPPVPKLERTISLGHAPLLGLEVLAGKFAPIVKKMSFSPDGRYLGLVETTSESATDIVVWDIEANKEQTRIHCDSDYADFEWEKLLWLQGGKVVTFGAGPQWDAMSGKALPDNPAVGGLERLNKDGTKMLTVTGTIGDPSTIHVYDTRSWTEQKIDLEGLNVGSAVWTADDKVIALVSETTDARGKLVNGHHVKPYDTAIRLIDPSGKTPTRDVWFAGEKTGDPESPLREAFPVTSDMETNFATNQVFLDGEPRIIDGATLAVRRYSVKATAGITVSPDGRWLFSKGMMFADPARKAIPNAIVDTSSGKPILEFSGGLRYAGGITVSPDGQRLAIGDENTVLLYSLK